MTFSIAVILPLLAIGCLGFAWFCFFQQLRRLPCPYRFLYPTLSVSESLTEEEQVN
jgi:hypothetical protein